MSQSPLQNSAGPVDITRNDHMHEGGLRAEAALSVPARTPVRVAFQAESISAKDGLSRGSKSLSSDATSEREHKPRHAVRKNASSGSPLASESAAGAIATPKA